MVKIVFYKSSSRYYDQACLISETFNNYSKINDQNIIQIDIDEINEKRKEFNSVCDIIKNWHKTEYFINEKKVNKYEIEKLLDVIDCARYNNNEDDEYCYSDCGWGCKFIESISLRNNGYRYNNYYAKSNAWYEYGHFENNTWIIDKELIKNKIYKEIKEKNLETCEHFDISKIDKSIALLPEKIEVSDSSDCKWEYKYRESPMGLEQTEIIGIKPKEDDDSEYNGGLTLSFKIKDEQGTNNEEQKRYIPNVTFEDIGGIDEIVQQIRETIELPLIVPGIFEHYHIKPHSGILLYGPPGCGKTLIAKAMANEIDAHFIIVNGPEILNKFMGQSEENIRKIFDEAIKFSPSIIYFDEFDSIGISRDNEMNPLMAPVVNQLLTLMDGVNTEDKICVIASTNRVDMIDEALKRPGRFDYVIEVKKPTPEGCKKIFNIHTKCMPIEKSFNKDRFVEKNLIGLSGAEIAFVATEAAYNSIRRTIDTKKILNDKKHEYQLNDSNIITEDDFNKAIKELKENRKELEIDKIKRLMN